MEPISVMPTECLPPMDTEVSQESENQLYPLTSVSFSNTDLLIEEIQRDMCCAHSQSSCSFIDDAFAANLNAGSLSISSTSLLNPTDSDAVKHVSNSVNLANDNNIRKKNNANNNYFRKHQRFNHISSRRLSWRKLNIKDRIQTLAQPKFNTNQCNKSTSSEQNDKYIRSTKSSIPRSTDGQIIPVTINPRLEELAKPRRSCGKWTGKRHCVWECDYPWPSPFCKGPGVQDAAMVDWARHSRPKPGPCPEPREDVFAVKKAALNATPTRRLEKLATPKKVIDSDEYYLWLLNKKPDVEMKLNPIHKLSIDKLSLNGIRVFLRCDLDRVDTRFTIKEKLTTVVPTIKYCLENGAKSVVIASHCGDPKGRYDTKLSLKDLGKELSALLGQEVNFLDDCIGPEAQALCEDPEPGSVFLLENLRFYPEEEGFGVDDNGVEFTCTKEQVQKFRQNLFNFGDVFVLDSIDNLVDTSNTTTGRHSQERAHGLSVKKELDKYNFYVTTPPKPMVAVIGGAFKDRIDIVYNIIGRADEIILGGEIAQIFLKTLKGIDIGVTECSPAKEKKVLNVMTRAKDVGCVINLPSDFVIRNTKQLDEYFTISSKLDVEPDFEIVDIGTMTRNCYESVIKEAASVVWVGDMGVLLDGTSQIGQAVSDATKDGMYSFITDEETHSSFMNLTKDAEMTNFDEKGNVVVQVSNGGFVSDVTSNGKITQMLLNKKMPKGLAALSPYRKHIKKLIPKPDIVSSKPVSITDPGYSMQTSMDRLCVDNMDVEDKRVLIVADLTAPVENGLITDNYVLRMLVPTIKWVLKRGARVVSIVSPCTPFNKGHVGYNSKDALTLKPMAAEMAKLLHRDINFITDLSEFSVNNAFKTAHPGSIILFENVLNEPEEAYTFNMDHIGGGRGRSPEEIVKFCERLSSMCDIYVNDAFNLLTTDRSSLTGCLHKMKPCGFMVKNELKYLAKIFNNPPRKFLAIIGGVEGHQVFQKQIEMVKNLARDVDEIIATGILGLHMLSVVQGMELGSMDLHVEKSIINQLLEYLKKNNVRVYYPVDMILSKSKDKSVNTKRVSTSEGIGEGLFFVDVGPKTTALYRRVVKRSKLCLWNGVLGITNVREFQNGTRALYKDIVECTQSEDTRLVSIACGTKLAGFIHSIDPNHEGLSHVSTGASVIFSLIADKHAVGLNTLSFNPRAAAGNINRLAMDHVDLRDKRVLLRVDFRSIPKQATNEQQAPIQELAHFLKALFKKGVTSVVLVGHIGDPLGRKDEPLSLILIKGVLEKILRQEIPFFDNGLNDQVEAMTRSPPAGSVFMLENVRFNHEELGYYVDNEGTRLNATYEDIDTYRSKLSKLGTVFINESMEALRTRDNSIIGIQNEIRVVGPELKKELSNYSNILPKIQPPVLCFVGGRSTIEKIHHIYDLIDVANDIVICGLVAITFLKVINDMPIGKTEFDRRGAKLVPRVIKKANFNNVNLHFPTDWVVPSNIEEDQSLTEQTLEIFTSETGIPEDAKAMDIGPTSRSVFIAAINEAKTITYTGRPGFCTIESFAEGTRSLVDAISARTSIEEEEVISIAYGCRDNVDMCLASIESSQGFSHISNAGPKLFTDILLRNPLPGLLHLNPVPDKPLPVLTMEQVDFKDKRVILRLDLDLPTVEGVVLDTDKIELALPTIKHILSQGPLCIFLCGCRGNPRGYKNQYLSMKPLVVEFEQLLGCRVSFLDEPCSRKTRSQSEDPEPGTVFLLENFKFYPAEMGSDEEVEDIVEDDLKSRVARTSVADLEDSHGARPAMQTQQTVRSDIDKLMYQIMEYKTVEQFTREIGDLADIFVNDDVTHMHEPLTSNLGLDAQIKCCGFQMCAHLRQGEVSDMLKTLPAIGALSPPDVAQ